ncbi:glycosyltransferase family 2 protein [Paenibacillus xylaniclasticus]|uniref:glycosyltransferase family 2 protein n=1 Tax=Paenibacillus xylaniclasticus TaxID=588083 RepID=UPI0013E06C90|nr:MULTISPECIES: glycosyltransferase family 2 protein [Paenibacillus]
MLSTYNGAQYLRDQLDSIVQQSYGEWSLLVRDDGSNDETLDILEEYRSRFPDRIEILETEHERLGACQSFARLLSRSTSPYVMFCDQDDVWKSDKVEQALGAIKQFEQDHDGPILVHTDMTVVDERLNLIDNSFWNYQGISGEDCRLSRILTHNNVTGCTCIMNARMRSEALPIPAEAIMHDWWIALVASINGGLRGIPSCLQLYRQHANNVVGAFRYQGMFNKVFNASRSRRMIEETMAQARALLWYRQEKMTGVQKRMVDDYGRLLYRGRIHRMVTLLRHRFSKAGLMRNVMFVILILLAKKEREGHRYEG